MAAPILAAGSSAENGFWGSVFGGLTEGAGKIVADVLPVWAAGQLGVEPAGEIGNPLNTSLGNVFGMPTAQNSFMDAGSVELSAPEPNTVLAIGAVLVGLIVVFKIL